MPTPDEHLARITGGKDIQIAMLRAEIDGLREENEQLQTELAGRSDNAGSGEANETPVATG